MRQNHPVFVSDAYQKESSLGAINRDLPDELVEDLDEEVVADFADAVLPRLVLMKRILELLL